MYMYRCIYRDMFICQCDRIHDMVCVRVGIAGESSAPRCSCPSKEGRSGLMACETKGQWWPEVGLATHK